MSTVEIRSSVVWGLIVLSCLLVLVLFGQISRTGELYKEGRYWEARADSLQAIVDSMQKNNISIN